MTGFDKRDYKFPEGENEYDSEEEKREQEVIPDHIFYNNLTNEIIKTCNQYTNHHNLPVFNDILTENDVLHFLSRFSGQIRIYLREEV